MTNTEDADNQLVPLPMPIRLHPFRGMLLDAISEANSALFQLYQLTAEVIRENDGHFFEGDDVLEQVHNLTLVSTQVELLIIKAI